MPWASLFGIHNLGEGYNEVGINHGDSGGPEFIDGKIAGVNDFGLFGYPGSQNISLDTIGRGRNDRRRGPRFLASSIGSTSSPSTAAPNSRSTRTRSSMSRSKATI